MMLRKPFKLLLLTVLFYVNSIYAAQYQTGDIIFHTSKSAQSLVIQKATHSPYSHMGMIVMKQGQALVLEAIQLGRKVLVRGFAGAEVEV